MFNVKSHHKKMVCYLTAVKGNLNFAQNRILNMFDNNCMSICPLMMYGPVCRGT